MGKRPEGKNPVGKYPSTLQKKPRRVSRIISNTASNQMSLARRILFHSRLGTSNGGHEKVLAEETTLHNASSSLDPTTSSSSQRQTTMVSTCTSSSHGSNGHESKPMVQVVAVDINHGMQC